MINLNLYKSSTDRLSGCQAIKAALHLTNLSGLDSSTSVRVWSTMLMVPYITNVYTIMKKHKVCTHIAILKQLRRNIVK